VVRKTIPNRIVLIPIALGLLLAGWSQGQNSQSQQQDPQSSTPRPEAPGQSGRSIRYDEYGGPSTPDLHHWAWRLLYVKVFRETEFSALTWSGRTAASQYASGRFPSRWADAERLSNSLEQALAEYVKLPNVRSRYRR